MGMVWEDTGMVREDTGWYGKIRGWYRKVREDSLKWGLTEDSWFPHPTGLPKEVLIAHLKELLFSPVDDGLSETG